MQRFVLVGVCLLGACYGKGKDRSGPVTGGFTSGLITAAPRNDFTAATVTTRMTEPGGLGVNGVEYRGFVAGAFEEVAIPNVYGVIIRQLGEGVQTSLQVGWMATAPLGRSLVFAKLMFDMLSTKKIGEVDTLSAFSPTFDVGIAPFGHGVCISSAATWDVQFNVPDRAIVGAYVGLCGGRLKR